MAGGTWSSQDKVRPGAYINIEAKRKTDNSINERGIATMPLILPWGIENKVVEVTHNNISDVLGMEVNEVIPVREALKKASKVLVYRLNTGEKAKKTLGTVEIAAAYSGEKGNSITVLVQANINEPSKFDVLTLMNDTQVDKQTILAISEFKTNGYITLGGTGSLQTTAGLKLLGGTNGTVTNAEYIRYLSAIELYEFNAMSVSTTDSVIKSLVTNFIKRLREQEGRKVQGVLENYLQADYEGIISVNNGVILQDRTIAASEATYFVAGVTAGATSTQSNTYIEYPGAIDVIPRYTSSEIVGILKNGEVVFTLNSDRVVIEQDINTLKTINDQKTYDFRKNRVIRVLDGIANDAKCIWDTLFIGKVDNSADGRNLYKKELIKMMESKQQKGAIENFVAEDILVERGINKDAVVSRIAVQPIDSMEKLYMEVEVQ